MEIPPFMSPKLPDDGAAIYGLRKVFKKAGYDFEIKFIPVPRIRAVGFGDEKINGFFPSFADEKFENKLILSKLFYQTPWVIVERKNNPIHWKTPKDLLKYKGGNVAGYVLRSQIADAYKNNPQQLESAPNDTVNILKLIHHRIDFIFIDLNAFRYISSTNAEVHPYADRLQVNPKAIAYNRYGIGFKTDPKSQKIMHDFNRYISEKEYTNWVTKYIDDQVASGVSSSSP
ncbi:MAG: substrate-binding periplasmic protein [Bacillota bacterium]